MVTLELTFKEREALVFALAFYQGRADDFAKRHWDVKSVEVKLGKTKCGDPGCTYCGDDPYYPED